MHSNHLQLVGRATLGPFVIDILDNALLDVLGILIGHQAYGELADDFLWYDSLCAGLIEGALNAMYGETGIAPSGLEQAGLVAIVRQVFDADVFSMRARQIK